MPCKIGALWKNDEQAPSHIAALPEIDLLSVALLQQSTSNRRRIDVHQVAHCERANIGDAEYLATVEIVWKISIRAWFARDIKDPTSDRHASATRVSCLLNTLIPASITLAILGPSHNERQYRTLSENILFYPQRPCIPASRTLATCVRATPPG